HGDRITDLHFAHDRGRGPLETVRTAARTRLLDLATRPGLARGGAARAVGRAQVQLAGEAGGALVVLDALDHRMRTTVLLLLVSRALVARRCRLAMSMPGLARAATGFLGGNRGGGLLGFQAQAFGLGLGFLALALGFLDPLLVLFGQPLLLAEVALARLLQLAQDLGTLVVAARGSAGRALLGGLFKHHLLAHDHVDRLAVLAAADRQFLLAAAAERDL